MFTKFVQRHRFWIFPVLLLAALTIFTATKISGSSVGMFNTFLLNKDQKNPGLIFNHPRGVRSDEWEVNTPLVVSQAKNNFMRFNPDIGNGQDMSVVLDVPYKEWSQLLKPQNWVFFVLPLEYAFAFKWWLLAVLLMLSAYIFCLKLLPKKHLFASFFAIALFCSPFIQWWYQSATILPLAYGLLICYQVITLLNGSLSSWKLLTRLGLFAYTLGCLIFVLYLPFVLPVMLVVMAFSLGHVFQLWSNKNQRFLLIRCGQIALACTIPLVLFLLFVHSRSMVIQTISNTVYPGHRIETSGGLDPRQLLGGYFNIQLQDTTKALHLPAGLNQSEASNFILIFPFIIPVILYYLLKKRSFKFVDWRIISLLTIAFGFCVRLFVHFSEFFFNTIQFNRVPHNRLLIGIGLTNYLLLPLTVLFVMKLREGVSRSIVLLCTLLAFCFPLVVGLSMRQSFVGYIGSLPKIIFISLIIATIVNLLLRSYFSLAIGLLVLLSVLSTYQVNPLYKGLQPIINSPLSRALQETGDANGRWLVSDDVIFENVTLANGLRSLSGVYAYPQLAVWQALKTQPSDEDIYNRYAHVFFAIKPLALDRYPKGAYLDPPALDAFQVNADPCSTFLQEQNVHYIITSSNKSNLPCLRVINTVEYPARTFKIYKIVH